MYRPASRTSRCATLNPSSLFTFPTNFFLVGKQLFAARALVDELYIAIRLLIPAPNARPANTRGGKAPTSKEVGVFFEHYRMLR
jgi:hypothetical protein